MITPGGLTEFEREPIRTRTGEDRAGAVVRCVKMGRPFEMTSCQIKEELRRHDNGEQMHGIAESYNQPQHDFEARMTLAGQWIAPYQGTTDGRLVLDLDEVGCHYEGTAIAWARMPQNLNSLVRFQTPSNTHAERIQKVPVVLIDNNGDPVTPGMLQHQKEQGIVYPATVDIDLALKGQNLTVSWVSSIGATGQAVATLPNTRCGAKSDLKVQCLNTWDGFKKAVNKLEKKRYVFRGQEDHNWRLRSSFHRTGRSNIERYLIQDISDLQKLFSSLSPHALI